MELSQKDFVNIHWKYYKTLEDDFTRTIRYVNLDEKNYYAFSIEYSKLILSVCGELDTILKLICGFKGSDRKTMKDYKARMFKKYEDLSEQKVSVKNTDIELIPFENDPMEWWGDYNAIKHNRAENFDRANLKTVLNALSALYLLEMHVYKDYFLDNETMRDLPDDDSNLFYVVGWDTKYLYGKRLLARVMGEI